MAIFVSPSQTAPLRQALASNYQTLAADSWGLLEAIIRSKPISAVVLDPTADSSGDVSQAERLIKKYSSVPFIAYVGVNAETVKAVARLGRVGLQDVLLVAHDDSPEHIKKKIDSVSVSPLTSVVLGELGPYLDRLPPSTAQTVQNLFHLPHRYGGAQDLAIAAEVTVTGLYRSFKAARLSSPKKLLIGARVLRGYKYLLEPEFSVENVATKACYASSRAFVRHVRQVFGLSPSRLRSMVPWDKPLTRLLDWLIEAQPAERLVPNGAIAHNLHQPVLTTAVSYN